MKNTNVYMEMPLNRVRQDALAGASLARQAWRQREPEAATRALGYVVDHKARVMRAVEDFHKSRKRRGKQHEY